MDLFSSGAPTWNRSGEALLQLSIKNIRAELSNSETTFATGYLDAWWSLNHREICVGKPARKKLDASKRVYMHLNMKPEQVDFLATRQCVCTAARRRSRDLTCVFEKAMRGSGVRDAQFTL